MRVSQYFEDIGMYAIIVLVMRARLHPDQMFLSLERSSPPPQQQKHETRLKYVLEITHKTQNMREIERRGG